MANKISCGGFYVDNETLQIDNGVLKCEIDAEGTAAQIHTVNLTGAN